MATRTGRTSRRIPALALAACALASAAAPVRGDAPAAPPEGPLTFLQDDYPRALAEARAKKSPLFLDFWAPW